MQSKTLGALMLGTALAAASVQAQPAIPANFEKVRELGGISEYTLKTNGLTVLLMEDRSAPVVTVMITYRVGSRNEVTGTTGATHLLEHLMFKGTDKYNRADGTGMDAMLQNRGALLNATTWLDRTNYYQNLPSEHLELAIDIEADRMRNLWLRDEDRQPEMTVVRNEFELGENNPISSLSKDIVATAIQAHPYHHSTIGWRSDIENVPITKLREFYDTYYWPNNATLTVIGDINTVDALKLVEQYFGVIPASPNPIPDVYTTEPVQRGPRRVQVKRAGQLGVVGIAYKVPGGLHADAAALTVLNEIIGSGRTSRLYRALVDKGLAPQVFAQYTRFKDPYVATLYAILPPGSNAHQAIEDSMWAEIDRVKEAGVTQEEVDRAISKFLTNSAFGRDGSFSIAGEINEAIAIGDWTTYVTFDDSIRAVTVDDVNRVARTYLVEDQTTTGWFIPQIPGQGPGMPGGARSWQDGPYFWRSEDAMVEGMNPNPRRAALAGRVAERKVGDIRVLSMTTNVEDVVTLTGSFAAGSMLNPADNGMTATVVASLLNAGTTTRDRFQIAETLENMGASISFSAGNQTVNFNASFLRKDMAVVMDLLADQLRNPVFPDEELTKVKQRLATSLRQQLDNTNAMANATMSRILFPQGHPLYSDSVETLLRHLDALTTDDLRAFHSRYYGPKSMIIVAVGDVEARGFQGEVQRVFRGWRGGVDVPSTTQRGTAVPAREELVRMPDKPSVTYRVGIPTGIKGDHADYLPLYIGTYILGGNFSARLMSTVRDQEGLTYGIGSGVSGSTFQDGLWTVNASFAPALLARGEESTMKQIRQWVEAGVTQEELDAKKSTITGLYQVQLATTGGIAGTLLNNAREGRPTNYIDTYVDRVNALTLDQVNGAIRKYVRLDHLLTVKAGTIPE